MIASKFLKPSQAFTFAFFWFKFNGTVSVRYCSCSSLLNSKSHTTKHVAEE